MGLPTKPGSHLPFTNIEKIDENSKLGALMKPLCPKPAAPFRWSGLMTFYAGRHLLHEVVEGPFWNVECTFNLTKMRCHFSPFLRGIEFCFENGKSELIGRMEGSQDVQEIFTDKLGPIKKIILALNQSQIIRGFEIHQPSEALGAQVGEVINPALDWTTVVEFKADKNWIIGAKGKFTDGFISHLEFKMVSHPRSDCIDHEAEIDGDGPFVPLVDYGIESLPKRIYDYDYVN